MKILAVGDIVGSAGINELKLKLKEIKEKEKCGPSKDFLFLFISQKCLLPEKRVLFSRKAKDHSRTAKERTDV